MALSRCNALVGFPPEPVQCADPDDDVMPDDRDRAPDPSPTLLDEAIVVAARRTRTAQQAVADELADEGRPKEALPDVVVTRAAALALLAQQAADKNGGGGRGPEGDR